MLMEPSGQREEIISDISRLLATLLAMKKAGKFQQAIDLIDDTLTRYFDFDSDTSNHVSEAFLDRLYHEDSAGSSQVTDTLATLLQEKGELLFDQNRFEESRAILNNALTLYFLLNDQQDFFSFERMNKMVMINQKLSSIELNIDS